jgi:hypothetical protein
VRSNWVIGAMQGAERLRAPEVAFAFHTWLVEFSYKLTGTGWGEARVADDSSEVVLKTSYLPDACSVIF